MNRAQLAAKAEQIVLASQGRRSSLPNDVQDACLTYAKKRASLCTTLDSARGEYHGFVEVQAAGSLECVPEEGVGILVFCSANRPGGGWLTGATAQEESVSRASTWALSCAHPVFHSDQGNDGYFYKNAALSVQGKVFERNNIPLPTPARAHFVGICAPNARAMAEHQQKPDSSHIRNKIVECLVVRMRLALQAFANAGCNTVVLGAVGCGVFRVRPEDCVRAWEQALRMDGKPFHRVVFGLGPNPSSDVVQAFEPLGLAFGPSGCDSPNPL